MDDLVPISTYDRSWHGVTTQVEGRGAVPGLRSPFPLEGQIPAMLAEDPFVCRMLGALDEVIAPAISSLDCFPAYLDPRTAPVDMLRYLASWLLATVDDAWNEESLRRDVSQAHARAKWAGTARALHERLVPHEVKSLSIEDPGSTKHSVTPTNPKDWKKAPEPIITLRVIPYAAGKEELQRIQRIARGLVPAHVVVKVNAAA